MPLRGYNFTVLLCKTCYQDSRHKYLFIMLRTIDMIITVIKKTIEDNSYLKIKFNHPNRKYNVDELLCASTVGFKNKVFKGVPYIILCKY